MKIILGGNGEEETPVPIPNTEVKLFRADGTALYRGGRVGRRRVYSLFKPAHFPCKESAGFFLST